MGTLTPIRSNVSSVVSFDKMLCAVDSATGNLYQYNPSSSPGAPEWNLLGGPGGFFVTNGSSIWATSPPGTQVPENTQIALYQNPGWTTIYSISAENSAQTFKQIAASPEGHLYIQLSDGSLLFLASGASSATPVENNIDPSASVIQLLANDASVYFCTEHGVWQWDIPGNATVQLMQVAAGGSHLKGFCTSWSQIAAVDGNGLIQIYDSSLGRLLPPIQEIGVFQIFLTGSPDLSSPPILWEIPNGENTVYYFDPFVNYFDSFDGAQFETVWGGGEQLVGIDSSDNLYFIIPPVTPTAA